jgi:DNA-binding MarR family transcriptional regulator
LHAYADIVQYTCICYHFKQNLKKGSANVAEQGGTGVKCYATALRKASRLLSQAYDAALDGSGIKTTQRAILARLERTGPMTVGALAQAMVMDPGGLAHTLKPLIRDGLAATSVDPSDKRSRLVAVTPEGVLRLRASDPGFAEAQARFERAFGREEAARLRDALNFLTSDQVQQALRGETPAP